jgi:myosin heavy subunit
MAQLAEKLQLVQDPVTFCGDQGAKDYHAIYFLNSEYHPQWSLSADTKKFDPKGAPATSVCTAYLQFLYGNDLGQYRDKFKHINIYTGPDNTLYFFKAPDEISRLKNATMELKTSNERLIAVAQGIKRQNVNLSQDVEKLTSACLKAANLESETIQQLRTENYGLNSEISRLGQMLEQKDEEMERLLRAQQEKDEQDQVDGGIFQQNEELLQELQDVALEVQNKSSQLQAKEYEVALRESAVRERLQQLEAARINDAKELEDEYAKLNRIKEERLDTLVLQGGVSKVVAEHPAKDALDIRTQKILLDSQNEAMQEIKAQLKTLEAQNTALRLENQKLAEENEVIAADALRCRTIARRNKVTIPHPEEKE